MIMKNAILLIIFILLTIVSTSQITIQSNDIGEANDTIRYSHSNFSSNDFSSTDTNYTWDYSSLVAKSQTLTGYKGMTSVDMLYTIAFFGKANIAQERDVLNVPGINITEPYTFLKKTSSKLKIVGVGGKANGVAVPIVYTSDDVIYNFPMNYGNLDSSDSHFSMNLASVGYIEEDLHRVNTVDGWGTIITPHGNYDCLRLKSEVTQSDSVYLTSTGVGLRLPQFFTEYIWLAKGLNFPVAVARVSITENSFKYIDDYIPFAGIESSTDNRISIKISPNPCSNILNISIDNNTHCSLKIYDFTGRLVFNDIVFKIKKINTSNWSSGVYFIEINDNKQITRKKFIKN